MSNTCSVVDRPMQLKPCLLTQLKCSTQTHSTQSSNQLLIAGRRAHLTLQFTLLGYLATSTSDLMSWRLKALEFSSVLLYLIFACTQYFFVEIKSWIIYTCSLRAAIVWRFIYNVQCVFEYFFELSSLWTFAWPLIFFKESDMFRAFGASIDLLRLPVLSFLSGT